MTLDTLSEPSSDHHRQDMEARNAFEPREVYDEEMNLPNGWFPGVDASQVNVPEGLCLVHHLPCGGQVDVNRLRVQIGRYRKYMTREMTYAQPIMGATFVTGDRLTVTVNGQHFTDYVGFGVFVEHDHGGEEYDICRVLMTA